MKKLFIIICLLFACSNNIKKQLPLPPDYQILCNNKSEYIIEYKGIKIYKELFTIKPFKKYNNAVYWAWEIHEYKLPVVPKDTTNWYNCTHETTN